MNTNEYRLPHGVADVMADTLISYFRNFHWMCLAGLVAVIPLVTVLLLIGPPTFMPSFVEALIPLIAVVAAEAIALSLVLPVARRALSKEIPREPFFSGKSIGRAGPLYVICAAQVALPFWALIASQGSVAIAAVVGLFIMIFTLVAPAEFMFGTGGLLKAFPRAIKLTWHEPWLAFWFALSLSIALGVAQNAAGVLVGMGEIPFETSVIVTGAALMFVLPFKAVTIAATHVQLKLFEGEDEVPDPGGAALEA